jgi:hypothetical protein
MPSWVLKTLDWIAIGGAGMFAFAGVMVAFAWLVQRKEEAFAEGRWKTFGYLLGLWLLLSFIPGIIALLAFASSRILEHSYIDQSQDLLGRWTREYVDKGLELLGRRDFLLGLAVLLGVGLLVGLAPQLEDWFRGRRRRRKVPRRAQGIREGFRRLGLVIGTVLGLIGAFAGMVLIREWSWPGAAVVVGLAALFFGFGWGVTRVVSWVTAGFLARSQGEDD